MDGQSDHASEIGEEELLKKAAEDFGLRTSNLPINQSIRMKSFIEGAKWMEERLKSKDSTDADPEQN